MYNRTGSKAGPVFQFLTINLTVLEVSIFIYLDTKVWEKKGERSMSEEIKRVKRELMYEGTILKVYKDHMQFENGNTAEWDFIHHDGAAAVVPIMEDGRILMVTQYRNALERDSIGNSGRKAG